ncbi:hypothetical protein V8F20_008614 [Naviculisporaceae sp. PSN 640]
MIDRNLSVHVLSLVLTSCSSVLTGAVRGHHFVSFPNRTRITPVNGSFDWLAFRYPCGRRKNQDSKLGMIVVITSGLQRHLVQMRQLVLWHSIPLRI